MVFGVAVCLTGRRVSLSSDDGGGHGGHGGGDGMKLVIHRDCGGHHLSLVWAGRDGFDIVGRKNFELSEAQKCVFDAVKFKL